jgi:diguanylate cyclase (GGDEF)-like protein
VKKDQVTNAHSSGVPTALSTWDILDLTNFRVYVVDVKSHEIIYANRIIQAQTGYRASTGGKCYQLIYQQDSPCLECRIPELIDAVGQPNGCSLTYERFNEAADAWFQLQAGTLVLSDGRTALYSIASDISAIKEMQNNLSEAHAELALKNQQLENLSVTDRLTGLYNRRKFDEVLVQECERALRTHLPLTLMMADIDHFKSVNDSHGHQVGDDLLVAIAHLLQQGVRKVDTVARWGGEEFMILCPATNLAGARLVAENIRRAIGSTDFPVVGHKACCFGVAEYRPDEAPDALVKRADEALYRAKNEGRNQVCTE